MDQDMLFALGRALGFSLRISVYGSLYLFLPLFWFPPSSPPVWDGMQLFRRFACSIRTRFPQKKMVRRATSRRWVAPSMLARRLSVCAAKTAATTG